MSEQSKEQTPTPWKVYEHKLPFMLGDKPRFHTERTIGTEADHPQLKAPYPVVTIATGLGMESGQIQKFVSLSESDARRIVACVNLLEGHDTEQIEGKTLEQYVGEQAFISGITVHEGFNVELNGLACQMFASAFAGQFKGSGAVNYLELGANHPEIGNFTVTIQRNEGKTPHQFLLAAEQQRDELLAALKEIVTTGDYTAPEGMKLIAKAAIAKIEPRPATKSSTLMPASTSTRSVWKQRQQ